jgi:hypothetical protein|tara:strand:+ start:144 stop:407 length:264 start_codon:yes stop_codon:yes gene_type:complete
MPTKKSPSAQRVIDAFSRDRARIKDRARKPKGKAGYESALNQRRARSIKERERRRDPLGVTRQSDIKELEAILRQQESGGYSRTYRK